MTRTCPCGHAYDWHAAPIIGYMLDGEGGALELRNCPHCHSTRAEQVTDRWAAADWMRGRADALAREQAAHRGIWDPDHRLEIAILISAAEALERGTP